MIKPDTPEQRRGRGAYPTSSPASSCSKCHDVQQTTQRHATPPPLHPCPINFVDPVKVDLIQHPVKAELQGLLGLGAIDVVQEMDLDLTSHGNTSFDGTSRS